ncbi:TlpA disulfide reductase family protein [Halalkalibacterium ligniniphilum]|uniref:TlpA disulfide reductase family protein n=1 Tax=Halalkalibacterium ligniniphilum TaxID=1134413 RepID=UPI00034684F0|nr:TlpA disulfide reductase family protein [Halalkalibacterium ligniniphilum]
MQAPMFTLLDGQNEEKVSLHDQKGKVVMITFWASWCPDSNRDLEQKEELFKRMQSDKLAFLTINVTGREAHPSDGLAFAKEKGFTFPVLIDEGTKTYDAYRCMSVPTTFILNENLEIMERFSDKATLMEIIQGLAKHLS